MESVAADARDTTLSQSSTGFQSVSSIEKEHTMDHGMEDEDRQPDDDVDEANNKNSPQMNTESAVASLHFDSSKTDDSSSATLMSNTDSSVGKQTDTVIESQNDSQQTAAADNFKEKESEGSINEGAAPRTAEDTLKPVPKPKQDRWFDHNGGSAAAEEIAVLDAFNILAKDQARTLAPGKIVLHSVAKEIADRHRELAHQCTQDGERKSIVAHLQAFLMNDRVLKALKQKRPPKVTSKPAVLVRDSGELHIVWSPHLDDREIDPLHFEICWGFRFTGAWSKCMCTTARHRITGLKPGTNYQIKVRALNAQGFGPYSEIATISTAKGDSSRNTPNKSKQQQSSKKPSIFGLFKAIPAGYEELVNSIIRPPRGVYNIEELGAPKFRIGRRIFHRSDFIVKNNRGLRLHCSHWEPIAKQRPVPKMPCIIYLHGNCGCRADAVECLEEALTHGFTLLSCDLSGSGKSEGEYISLGWHEQEDVRALIRHAVDKRNASGIYLWGRSMGAVTSLLVAASPGGKELIKGMVLDSPFEDLWTLAQELVVNTEIKIPSFAIGMVRMMIRNSVQKRADFNIDSLSPIKLMPTCRVPALFAAGNDDGFVGPHHAENLFNAHGGHRCKQFVRFPGDHNSIRENWFLDKAMLFLQNGTPVKGMPYNVPAKEVPTQSAGISSLSSVVKSSVSLHEGSKSSQKHRQQDKRIVSNPHNDNNQADKDYTNKEEDQRRSQDDDVLNVSAVLGKMQDANSREYVASLPQPV